MLNKQDIIREYNKVLKGLRLKSIDLWVDAGAACVLYGVRETTVDIDADIPDELFDKLIQSKKYQLTYFQVGQTKVGVLKYNNVVDLHRASGNTWLALVDGVYCYNAEYLLWFNMSLNRPRDQADIAGLNAILENRKQHLKG